MDAKTRPQRGCGLKAAASLAALLAFTAMPAAAQTERQKALAGATVNILAVQMPQYAPLWAQIPEFEQQYGIKVNLEEASFDQMREKSLLDMSQGTGRYDIFTVDVMWLAEYVSAGYLHPLTQYVKDPELTAADYDVDDFLPRIYSGNGMWDGAIYNLPIGAGVTGHVFRKDMMEQAGLAVPEWYDKSWTTERFMEAVEKLNNPDAGVAGYVSQPQRWFWGWTFTQLMHAFQTDETAGDEFVDENWNVTINSPQNLEALKWYVGLAKYGPAGSANFGYPEMLSLYQQGKAAGALMYTEFVAGDLEDPRHAEISGKNIYLHTAIGPHGKIDPWFGSWGLGISRDSKNKEAAWTFMQWITHKNQSLKALKGGTAPTRHSTYKSEEAKQYTPHYVGIYDFMLNTTNPDTRIRVPEWAEISDVMGLYGNQAWLGEITPEEALTNMESEIKAAFRRGGYYREGAKNPPQLWRDLSVYDAKPSSWK
ncbi:sugar ABC transporter substrate-binding protein [Chelativorans sp.]|uniref:ABC transporter substrate-binding protein n=1 Tax=Chelativorans sp. TaxID=2203393 RepID=UPI002810C9FE|nr:sugar ABC transporter substrate-binding protein [Chelativorans sp.]